MNISFHSFIYSQIDKAGHLFHYQLSMRRSIQSLGLRYRGYLNTNCTLTKYPDDWDKSLRWIVTGSRLGKLPNLFTRFLSFCRFFLRKSPKKRPRILFVESPNAVDFFSLTLASFFCARKIDTLWFMFHFDYRSQPFSWRIHKSCIKFLNWKLNKRLRLFTLSDLTKLHYEKNLNLPVQLLPYPYTLDNPAIPNTEEKNLIWWPGSPRAEKGFDTILFIADQFRSSSLRLALSETASLHFKKHPQLLFIKAEQEREEYLSFLKGARGVLLPYCGDKYRLRSSGIFIESIITGKPAFVREGTWLASELRKHNLEELILDWERPDIIGHIESLLKDQKMLTKLSQMQNVYRDFHSLDTHTRLLEQVLTSSSELGFNQS